MSFDKKLIAAMKNNTSRRVRERREARLRIIDAARELFAAGGEEALTLRRVAEKIEYSATTIYLHFQNKGALVRELCAADFAAFSRQLVQADRLNDPLDRLKKVASGYVDFGLQYPGQYRAMFITMAGAEPADADRRSRRPGERSLREEDAKVPTGENEKAAEEPGPYDFLQAAVFKATAAGIFKAEYRDVPLITQTLWAGLHGVVALHQVRAGHARVAWRPIQVQAEMMIECLLNGMILPALATGPAWRRSGG